MNNEFWELKIRISNFELSFCKSWKVETRWGRKLICESRVEWKFETSSRISKVFDSNFTHFRFLQKWNKTWPYLDTMRRILLALLKLTHMWGAKWGWHCLMRNVLLSLLWRDKSMVPQTSQPCCFRVPTREEMKYLEVSIDVNLGSVLNKNLTGWIEVNVKEKGAWLDSWIDRIKKVRFEFFLWSP